MHKERNSRYQKTIYSASLFALAVLMLVISCPLKRLMNNNYVSQTSIPSNSNKTSSTQYSTTLYSTSSSCCAANNKVAFIQVNKLQQLKVDAPIFTVNIANHTGYYIHSFLNDIKPDYNLAYNSDYSPLSLFLQHRSLLI